MTPKTTLITLFFLLWLGLTACNQAETPAAAPSESPSDQTALSLNQDYADALTIRNQLLLGIIRLEDGPNAISPEQAAQLAPLWQAMKSLTESGTAAEEEIAAVQAQIIGLLTPQQVAAIAEMGLTNADTQAYYVEIGASTPSTPQATTEGETSMRDLPQEDRRATREAEGATVGSGSGKGNILLDNVIALLQAKAA